jgi:hypothetical protein
MKKLLLFGMILAISMAGFAQNRAFSTKEQRNLALKRGHHPIQQSENSLAKQLSSGYKATNAVIEAEIGNTYYDLQSNVSCQNRFHVYDDGTMGAAWTYGLAFPNFSDRGTGYNYFDGTSWGPFPTARIETIRAGWPSYAPYGENGEMVVSHNFANGTLFVEKRNQKGTGAWTESILAGPESQPISWPRATTSGINHDVIHNLAITWPVANSGTIYQGLDGALLYSRSTDGGATWNPQNVILDGLDASFYTGFSADQYEWAASDDDHIAFLVGDSWQDFVLMKSSDGGDSWTKTVIWEHPYPFWATGTVTDTFYCIDGAHHLAFDSENIVHVVFGINRAYSDGTNSYWFPLVDGLGYWNENRPTFSNGMDALNPYGDPGTELVDDYSLIGWSQDINNNGTWDILGDVGLYYLSPSSMPQITITEDDEIYVVFSSVTETYNNGTQDYRHLWARYSPNGDFWGPFRHLTSDLIHIFDECVFPSVASYTDDYLYLIYQTDIEPGLAVRGDLDPYGDNLIRFMKVDISDIFVSDESQKAVNDYDVLQNFPNPATGLTTINVNIRKDTQLTVELLNTIGQKVMTVDAGNVKPGMNSIVLDVSALSPGMYFYTVKAGDAEITKKMIVE